MQRLPVLLALAACSPFSSNDTPPSAAPVEDAGRPVKAIHDGGVPQDAGRTLNPDGGSSCSLTIPADDAGWILDGDAIRDGDTLLLTSDGKNQSGAAWWKDQARFDRFDVTVHLLMKYDAQPPADGMAFAWVKGNDLPKLGDFGGTLGLNKVQAFALAIYLFDPVSKTDNVPNFSLIDTKSGSPTGWALDRALISGQITNGQEHLLHVTLEGGAVTASLDGTVAIDHKSIEGYEPYKGYWGVSAATGGSTSTTRIRSVTYEGTVASCP